MADSGDAAHNDWTLRSTYGGGLMSISSACMDSSSTQWMFNSAGQSPCEVLDQVVKTCEASASVPNLSVDVSCGSLGTNSSSACCCSTATFALVSACWVCQTNRAPSLLSSTYQSWWSGCALDGRLNGSLPAVVIAYSPPITVPNWALIRPASSDAKWNPSSAQLAVGITPTPTPSKSSSSSSAATSTSSVVPPPAPNPPPYAPIAICSALALVLLLGMAAWLYRRRNRVSHSCSSPDFDIDGNPSRGLISNQENSRPGWAWWRKKAQNSNSRLSQSDPGKIDAWRYPFDYEPVSTGPSSGSGGSGRGEYYDLHRPRRNSDAHLAPRSSMDTLAVRGQASSATLGQYYRQSTPVYGSTQNLAYGRATPSPVPGHTSQLYAPPQGVNVNHLSSFAYGSPQPPTYVQTVPYTYPYAVQPVPSTSTTSPLSPHYAQSPSRRGQVLMIPVDSVSPDQIQQLRSQFPDLRVRTKKKRRARDGSEGRDRGRARAGTDADQSRPEPTRPRSMSVPAQVEEDEWDGRPRNGVELREKYERRRSRDRVVVISVGDGVRVEGSGSRPPSGGSRPASGGTRPASGGTRPASGGTARQESAGIDGRRTSRIRGPRERAQDGGVRLMGGPPPHGPILG